MGPTFPGQTKRPKLKPNRMFVNLVRDSRKLHHGQISNENMSGKSHKRGVDRSFWEQIDQIYWSVFNCILHTNCYRSALLQASEFHDHASTWSLWVTPKLKS